MSELSLHTDIKGRFIENEPMARHCSWRSGGCADRYFEPQDRDDLALFLAGLPEDEAITWVGLGSNLLVRDGGYRGTVIAVLNRVSKLELLDDGRVYAQCGVTCAKFSRFCQEHGLAEADFLAGIPGTIGGALAMNAGAFSYETWDYVEQAEMMSRQGKTVLRQSDEFDVGYRRVLKKENEWFSGGYFKFPLRKDNSPSRIKPLLERRNKTQPIGQPSCGSVFKNPRDDHAARLIEACGLKGFCLGGACVSEKHANFIINQDGASASEIEDLISLVQMRVQEQFSISLSTEVRIIGERE